MNCADTPEETTFRARAREFLEIHAPRYAVAAERRGEERHVVERAKAWQACKHEHGWACPTWPAEYGGKEVTPIEAVIFRQEEALFDTPPNLFIVGTGFMAPAIMTHGMPEQRARYLQRMARGDDIWCQLFSEPAAGSDLAGLRTSAVRDGDGWILNGQKNWTTLAHIADFGVIVTRTDLDVPKHAGLTCFIVDMHAPGIEIRPLRQMDGEADFNEVFLADVRVPDANRLGGVGEGWAVAITVLMHERQTISSGPAPLDPGDLLALARRCGLAADPAVRQRLADFYVRATGLTYTGYRIMTAFSRGQTPGPEFSIGKLVGARLRQEMASWALELQGPAGTVMEETPWQAAYLSTPGLRIAGGTEEVLRNIIAERVLGLPPEPRDDKRVPFRQVPVGAR
jgi:acyl-CoA dehydrogenase